MFNFKRKFRKNTYSRYERGEIVEYRYHLIFSQSCDLCFLFFFSLFIDFLFLFLVVTLHVLKLKFLWLFRKKKEKM